MAREGKISELTCRSTSSASVYCLLRNSIKAALFAAWTSHRGVRLAIDSALCPGLQGEARQEFNGVKLRLSTS